MEYQSESLSPAEDFSRINYKIFLPLNNMVENFKYPILKVHRTETQFGEEVQIELYDNIVSAPKSYNNKITDDDIEEYNTGHYYLKKVMKINGFYDLEFERGKFVRGYKKILPIADMLDHISYQIFEMQRKDTIYGEKIMLDALEHKIFLSKSFNRITDETINEVNRGNYCIKKVPLNSKGCYRLEIQTVPINFRQDDVSLSEVDNEVDVSASTTAMVSPPNNTNEVQPENIYKFRCLVCPRKHVIHTEENMFIHMKKIHNLDNIDNSEKIIRDQEKKSCKYCKLKYRPSYLYQHMRNQHSTEHVTRVRSTSKVHTATETSLSSTSFSPSISFSPCNVSNAALDETSPLRSPEYNFYENGMEVISYGTLVKQESSMEL